MAGGNMFNFRALSSALAILLLTPLTANAVSLSLNGDGANLQMDNTQAVYASDSNGVPMLITEVGMRAPGGGIVTEVGVPSMMPDGRVIFGAETQPKDPNIKARWNIFIGNADAVPSHRMIAALNPKALEGDCVPAFKGDPYPVADMDENISFISTVPHGRDALFFYSHGKLACMAKAGDKTREGHEIAVLSFGSAQMGEDGQVVFTGFLGDSAKPAGHRQALLLASMSGRRYRACRRRRIRPESHALPAPVRIAGRAALSARHHGRVHRQDSERRCAVPVQQRFDGKDTADRHAHERRSGDISVGGTSGPDG